MKRIVTFTTASAISALIATSVALADDYNSGVVTKSPSEGYTDVEFGSGWYLRGDISYNINGRDDAGINEVSTSGGTSSLQVDYDDAVGIRIGVGHYLTSNFRVEANLESIFSSEFGGIGLATFSAIDTGTVPPTPTTTGGTQQIDADYQGTALIASGNLDLGRVGAFTPYVGAGLGIARLEYNETETLTCTPFNSTVSCTGFPAAGPGVEAIATRTRNTADWTYAYQLTVGTAVAVADRTSLDFSYSFTQIGDGDSLSYADGTAVDEDGVRLHQVRAGLRYDLW